MNDLAETKRLRAENEKHKLLWQEAEKRVFGADMWVRGVTDEIERLRAEISNHSGLQLEVDALEEDVARLRANALTAEEAQDILNTCYDLGAVLYTGWATKLQRIASQNLPSNKPSASQNSPSNG